MYYENYVTKLCDWYLLVFHLSITSNLTIPLSLLTICETGRLHTMSLAIITLDSCCPTKCVLIHCLIFWTTSRFCFILRRSLKYGGKESLTNEWDNIFSMANYQMVVPKKFKLLIVKETIFLLVQHWFCAPA